MCIFFPSQVSRVVISILFLWGLKLKILILEKFALKPKIRVLDRFKAQDLKIGSFVK